MNNITFCVAAKNEGRTIGQVIQGILDSTLWKLTEKAKLLVCVNGSTDDTAAVVREYSAKNSNIRLILLDVSSKSVAWNTLVQATSVDSETLVFVDGDVSFEPNAFELLSNRLQSDASINVAAALTFAAADNETPYGFSQRLIAHFINCRNFVERRKEWGGICGAGYAIRRAAAVNICLPPDGKLAEDAVLTAELKDSTTVVPEAKVYYVAPNFKDLVRQNARMRRSNELLKQFYPRISKLLEQSRAGIRSKSRLAAYMALPLKQYPGALLWFLAGQCGKLLCRYYAWTGRNSWPIPCSTKQPISRTPA